MNKFIEIIKMDYVDCWYYIKCLKHVLLVRTGTTLKSFRNVIQTSSCQSLIVTSPGTSMLYILFLFFPVTGVCIGKCNSSALGTYKEM